MNRLSMEPSNFNSKGVVQNNDFERNEVILCDWVIFPIN